MSYIALRFDSDAADADAWSDALIGAGALAVDISDPRAGAANETPVYAEPTEPIAALWPISRLSALFDAGSDAATALSDAARALARPLPVHEMIVVPEQDWVRATQAQFGPVQIADDFWIVPSWRDPPDPRACNLVLDPGLAFGTGSHPTTRLMLEWLHAHVRPGDSVLDYGCGSGILTIAAARLGAKRAVGTDIDQQAITASTDNARINDVAALFVSSDRLPAETFDIVVANILTRPLIVLAPALASRVARGGSIALAGILDTQAPMIVDVYSRWFNIAPWRTAAGWSLLAGARRPTSGGAVSP